MQRPMLNDQCGTVNAGDLAVRERLTENGERPGIVAIPVDRGQNGIVEDQEIGVGQGEAVAVFIIAGRGPGQGEQSVGIAGRGQEGLESAAMAVSESKCSSAASSQDW